MAAVAAWVKFQRAIATMFVLARPAKNEIDHELLWGSLGVFLFATAWTHPLWERYYALPCPMKAIFGVPCALCGGTRAFEAWTHGHPVAAWTWNPLAASLAAFVTVFIIYAGAAILRPGSRRIRIQKPLGDKKPAIAWTIRLGALAVVLLNWAYLIHAGR